MRHQFKVAIYLRKQKVSSTGKAYWGFEAVKLGQGRKPTGSFYLRHVNDNGKQEWVAAGQRFENATALRDKLLAPSAVLPVASLPGRVACCIQVLCAQTHM
jgi:hypothetical protein